LKQTIRYSTYRLAIESICLIVLFFIIFPSLLFAEDTIKLELLSNYQSGYYGQGAAEIVAYDADNQRLFYVNSNDVTVDVLDISDPAHPTLEFSIDVTPYGNGANSVAVFSSIVAVAVEANPKQNLGQVTFFDTGGDFLGSVAVGALPDMLTFTPNGQYVLVANEGEPNADYSIDPEGSISIIDVSGGAAAATAVTADFNAFDAQKASLIAAGVRIFGPGATVSQDLEPEYIAVDEGSTIAWVTLQENNALAKVDIASATVTDILPLGFKDHSLARNSFDASNRDDGINIRTWPVLGMYQPDAIASYTVGGNTYLVTANEGDSRDYGGFSEEKRCGNLLLDPNAFPPSEMYQKNENLGRLKITTTLGDADGDGDFDKLYSYGARSFSIWDADGNQIYDSGNEMELLTSQIYPKGFNSTENENDSFDNRSDDKGPEPEGIVIGSFHDRNYVFVGLERSGGIIVYDITDPKNTRFATYVNNRDFSIIFEDPTPAELAQVGDLAPEGLAFIDAAESPNGHPLLVVANEVSGSISIYQVKKLIDGNDPFCQVVNRISGSAVSFEVAIQDKESGIASVEILKAKNVDVIIPEFVAGSVGQLMINMIKAEAAKDFTVVLRVRDRAGNETIYDPKL